jgi:hypothetical protein
VRAQRLAAVAAAGAAQRQCRGAARALGELISAARPPRQLEGSAAKSASHRGPAAHAACSSVSAGSAGWNAPQPLRCASNSPNCAVHAGLSHAAARSASLARSPVPASTSGHSTRPQSEHSALSSIPPTSIGEHGSCVSTSSRSTP